MDKQFYRNIFTRRNNMKLYIEIRAAEGGNDAKLLTSDQAKIYMKYSEKNGIKTTVLTDNVGQDCL
jgi:protein subunit release factor A